MILLSVDGNDFTTLNNFTTTQRFYYCVMNLLLSEVDSAQKRVTKYSNKIITKLEEQIELFKYELITAQPY